DHPPGHRVAERKDEGFGARPREPVYREHLEMIIRISARLHGVVERRHDHHPFTSAYAGVRRVNDESPGKLRVLGLADLTAAARRTRAVEESTGRHGREADRSTLARSKDH